jgi:signal transduction histidine kinase
VVNLLDNALKYAPAHSEVTLSLAQTPDGVALHLADQGPGIPESERARVFDRFQRLEAHRGSPGVGLGLSLVQAIVRHHGGRIALQDNAPGLRVQVLLPLP